MKDAIGSLLVIFIIAAILVVLVAACETPSESREDRQQHEINMVHVQAQAKVDAAQVLADARIEEERLRAEAAQARAAETQARADAQIALAREQNRHSEDMYVLYSTTLAAYLGKNSKTNLWIAAILGLVAGAGLIIVGNKALDSYLPRKL